MNYFDEAIETKQTYIRLLRSKRERLRAVQRTESATESKLKTNIKNLVREYEDDLRGLQTADCYFWEPRITQLVLASGQQLPPTVKFQQSWLPAPSGWWWFGRSSPLIGLSKNNERKYVHSLFYRMGQTSQGDDCVHIETFADNFEQLGTTTWRVKDDLAYSVSLLREAFNEVSEDMPHDLRVERAVAEGIAELIQTQIETGQAKATLDWLSSKIVQVKAFLTDEGREAFEALKTDKERLQFLENLRQTTPPEPSPAPVVPDKYEDTAAFKARLLDWREASVHALLVFACGNLWLQQRIVVTDPGVLSRSARRRLERADLSTEVLVVRLRKKEYAHSHKEGEPEPVDWAWQWAVRGHWRDQPTKDGIKLIWIHPYIKGPPDRPLKAGAERIFHVGR